MTGEVVRGPVQVVVMGVSGTGKTSVAERLAEEAGLAFVEGDAHHSPESIAKMTAGVPLTDEDRAPWLRTLAGLLEDSASAGTTTVLTCSALRRSYRDVLRGRLGREGVFFVHLDASLEVLEDRMSRRRGHFMPTSLLASQLATLEPLGEDEHGLRVDVAPPLDVVVAEAVRAVVRAVGDPARGRA